MKKFLAFMLAAIMVLAMVSCGGKKDEADTTEDKANDTTEPAKEYNVKDFNLVNEGVLTVGAEIGYPPFEQYADDGVTAIGYDVDLANAIGKKLGLEVKFIDTAFDTIDQGLGVNYDVIIAGYTINPERLEQMLFSEPYINSYQAVIVRKDSDIKIEKLTDITGHSVAFQEGTTSGELINDMKDTGTIDCTIVSNEKMLACFTMLEKGEVDMVICDSPVANIYLKKNPDAFKLAFQDTENPEQFGIAMPKTNTALQSAINDIFKDLEDEGFFQEEEEYWFSQANS